jgi:hypothetical protein
MDAASDFVRDRERSPSTLGATLAAIVESSDDAILTKDLDASSPRGTPARNVFSAIPPQKSSAGR